MSFQRLFLPGIMIPVEEQVLTGNLLVLCDGCLDGVTVNSMTNKQGLISTYILRDGEIVLQSPYYHYKENALERGMRALLISSMDEMQKLHDRKKTRTGRYRRDSFTATAEPPGTDRTVVDNTLRRSLASATTLNATGDDRVDSSSVDMEAVPPSSSPLKKKVKRKSDSPRTGTKRRNEMAPPTTIKRTKVAHQQRLGSLVSLPSIDSVLESQYVEPVERPARDMDIDENYDMEVDEEEEQRVLHERSRCAVPSSPPAPTGLGLPPKGTFTQHPSEKSRSQPKTMSD